MKVEKTVSLVVLMALKRVTPRWSEVPIVRRANSPKVRYSEGPIVRRADSPKGRYR